MVKKITHLLVKNIQNQMNFKTSQTKNEEAGNTAETYSSVFEISAFL